MRRISRIVGLWCFGLRFACRRSCGSKENVSEVSELAHSVVRKQASQKAYAVGVKAFPSRCRLTGSLFCLDSGTKNDVDRESHYARNERVHKPPPNLIPLPFSAANGPIKPFQRVHQAPDGPCYPRQDSIGPECIGEEVPKEKGQDHGS